MHQRIAPKGRVIDSDAIEPLDHLIPKTLILHPPCDQSQIDLRDVGLVEGHKDLLVAAPSSDVFPRSIIHAQWSIKHSYRSRVDVS